MHNCFGGMLEKAFNTAERVKGILQEVTSELNLEGQLGNSAGLGRVENQ